MQTIANDNHQQSVLNFSKQTFETIASQSFHSRASRPNIVTLRIEETSEELKHQARLRGLARQLGGLGGFGGQGLVEEGQESTTQRPGQAGQGKSNWAALWEKNTRNVFQCNEFFCNKNLAWQVLNPIWPWYMGVSEKRGTPKSSILIGFSVILTIQFGVYTPIFWETPLWQSKSLFVKMLAHMWSKGKKRVKKSSLKGKSAKGDLFFQQLQLMSCSFAFASFDSCVSDLQEDFTQSISIKSVELIWIACTVSLICCTHTYYQLFEFIWNICQWCTNPVPFFGTSQQEKFIRGEPGEADTSASGSKPQKGKALKQIKQPVSGKDRTYGPLPMQFMNVLCFVLVGSSGSCIVTIRLPNLFVLLVYTWLWSVTSISIVTRRHAVGLHWSNDCHLSKEMTIRDCLANKKCIYCRYGWIQMRAGTSHELRTAKWENMISW